jgi:hypothetical protein
MRMQRSRIARDVAIVLWSSFLAAAVGTMLFFAYFDPALLAYDDDPPFWLADRMMAYTAGFFFLWFITALAGMFVAYLIDTASDRDDMARDGSGRTS